MSIPKSIKKASHPQGWADRPGGLTDRQLGVLVFVRRYWQTFRCSPSVREACTAFSVASSQGMQRHLTALERKGALAKLFSGLGFCRGYEVTSLGLTLTATQDLSPLPRSAVKVYQGRSRVRCAAL